MHTQSNTFEAIVELNQRGMAEQKHIAQNLLTRKWSGRFEL